MVIKEALEDACGKNDGVLGRGVEGVDDGHQVEGAPVRLVHGLPQLRVLIPSVPSCQSLLRKDFHTQPERVQCFSFNYP